MNINNEKYREAFALYLKRGITPEVSMKEAEGQGYYIWRTVEDEKVRPAHAANNGKIFSWNDPPPTGHPGEEYGCRCRAEEYIKGKTEFAAQNIISEIDDDSYQWDDIDFTKHFYLGNGQGVTLSETGNLQGIINYYFL